MLSRSLSPPRRARHGCGDDHRAVPSMSSLYLRPRRPSKPVRKVASMPALPPATAHVYRVQPSSPPPPPPPPPYDIFDPSRRNSPYGIIAATAAFALLQPQQVELGSGSQPKHQEESGSELELELESPPHLTLMIEDEDEPGSPTSPPRCDSPPSKDMEPAMSPTLGSDADTEECRFSDEDDPYFESLADRFTAAAEDVCKPNLPKDDIDYKAYHKRKSDLYAMSALMHYNANEENKVKYELISVIASCGTVGDGHCYGHVNFTAKGNQENSKEQLFFAELRREDYLTYVPTCVLSLEGGKSVGGLRGTRYDDNFNEKGLLIDAQHCYACTPRVKHPKNGTLYKSGHVACSDFYFG